MTGSVAGAFDPFLVLFQGPKGRKERDERHCLGTDVSSHKTLEDRGNSAKEARGDAAMAPLVEKGPE